MFEAFDVSYSRIQKKSLVELYGLRKRTFSDRLGWKVVCSRGMEFDEFDNPTTQYILGLYQGQIICSVRLINLDRPNMITHTFYELFKDISLPSHGIESSRFFVDKERARQAFGESFPISKALFLAMINWAQQNKYEGIYTVVSKAMTIILKRSGWKVKVLKEAYLTEDEKIYLLYLPAGKKDQEHMVSCIAEQIGKAPEAIWPLKMSV